MNLFLSTLFRFINNPGNKDINYQIAYTIIESFDDVQNLTLNDLAKKAYVSVPSVKKFLGLFGLRNLQEFKSKELLHRITRMRQLEDRLNKHNEEQLLNTFKTILTPEDYDDFVVKNKKVPYVDLFSKADKIYLYGADELIELLLRFQIDMTTMRKLVLWGSDLEATFEAPKENDLVIFFSLSGQSIDTDRYIIPQIKATHVPIIQVGYRDFSVSNFLIKIPKGYDESIEAMMIVYFFQALVYQYYQEKYKG